MWTLADCVRLNARRRPDADALVDEAGRLTHRELSARAEGIARGLRAAGIGRGDHVGILAGNSIFCAEAFLGVIAAGAVAVMYNWRWATAELVQGIMSTDARVILAESRFEDSLDAALATGDIESPPTVFRQGSEFEALAATSGQAVEPGVGPDDPMCVLFTGGTTGFSKGVVLAHRSGIVNALNERLDVGIANAAENVGLNVTPMFHSAALLCVFAPHYMSGGANVLLHRFDEQQIGEFVERERITTSFMIPNMVRRLLQAGVFETPGFRTHLRQLHSGGGLLRMPDKLAVRELTPQVRMFFRYGLTEAGPMVTRLLDRDIMRPELDGSIGQEYSMVEARVVDLVSGEPVGTGELGEIAVRGPGVMLGYYNNPEATAEAVREGWLHTGDLATQDEEGYFYFRDRAKDMIKTGGENVFAAEIEQILYTHPAVMECGVLGVPSAEWDEEVRAVVALRPGQRATEAELREYLRRFLAGYKIPKQFVFMEPGFMPVNPSGKIVKSNLRQLVGW
ncbi:class I adenylate-forming enzyme family protein [Amycolatopsis taiwanensis]|uniref:class I adenylate-forming enzyme family protein n=1 Tax=Amycolatopsis taiwanensis TaxID=342230 RepID=UPI00048471E4|nr:AMP-binding protein [Amycolatopsis taiwanensis]